MKNKIVKLILFFALFTFEYQNSQSQWAILKTDADSLVRLGTDYIYNIEFDKAHDCFTKIKDMYPWHPASYFLDAMIDWWKITLYRNTNAYDKSFETKIDKVIEVCNSLLDKNEFDINALFFKAGALGFRGRYYAQKQSWVNAATDGASAFDLMNRCQRLAPGNHDIMLGTGIYNYFAETIPEKYPYTRALLAFLPKGDKQLGIYQLRAAAHNARYAAVEARVVLLQIYYSFENDNDFAYSSVKELFEKYPNNPYFHRYYGRVLVRQGKMDEFEQMWREILLDCMDNKQGYDKTTAREAMYYIGLALFRKQNFNDALKYFLKADEGSKIIDKDEETGFGVNVKIFLGNIYDFRKNRTLAKQYYNKVLDMKDIGNSHQQAKAYLNKPYGQ
jgi:tetratricopeptide (TPR) repeat protein